QEMLLTIENASPAQLKRWLTPSAISIHNFRDVMELIVARLASQDPQNTLAFLQTLQGADTYYPIVMAEWARTDITGAIDAFLAIDSRGLNIGRMVAHL